MENDNQNIVFEKSEELTKYVQENQHGTSTAVKLFEGHGCNP
jgi:hypothetical protein